MKMHILRKELFVPVSVGRVFEFFSAPGNLARLTPPDLGFMILTPEPVEMKQGALIDYTVRLLGLQVRWTTLITAYDPPDSFVDEQLKGPYSFWHHTHRFTQVDGGTVITDEVRYVMPFGPVGNLVHSLFVKNNLEKIFGYREKTVQEIFAGPLIPGMSAQPQHHSAGSGPRTNVRTNN